MQSPKSKVPKALPAGPAWRREQTEQSEGHSFRYLWNPRFLKHAFDVDPTPRLRSPRGRSSEPIVLADILGLDDKTIPLQARLIQPEPRRKRYTLEVELLGPVPPNKRARVTVTWAGHVHSAFFVNGHATIKDLPAISSAQAHRDEPDWKFGIDLDFEDLPRGKKA